MVFTLEDLFVELEKFYYYSIYVKKKGEILETQYECILVISLSAEGTRHTRRFEEISLGDLFQSIEGFVDEMIIKKEAH